MPFNWKSEDVRPVFGAFLLALLLWAAVTTNREYSIRIDVPFRISQLAPGYTVISDLPRTVSLQVRGKGRALLMLYFYKPRIRLELTQVRQDYLLDLNQYRNQIYVGQELGIDIVEIIDPKIIPLRVDRLGREKRPVQVIHQIKPAPGYVLLRTEPELDSVEVSGPVSLLRRMRYVTTDTLKEEGVKYPFSRKVYLHSIDPRRIIIKPEQLEIRFIVEQLVERNIYQVPIQIIGVPDNLSARANPAEITVRVKGSESQIAALKKEDISVIFDYGKEYRLGRIHFIPRVEVPQDIQVVNISPGSFRLLLRKIEE